ncbi:hypothetical protein Tco_0624292 [Tanacetum coccineum]|uniref:Uncharacterized protein n=1 Tax=Tanacetum coccineum TaxID=301880 RepID=A0ABQ4WDJ1_9ASTR
MRRREGEEERVEMRRRERERDGERDGERDREKRGGGERTRGERETEAWGVDLGEMALESGREGERESECVCGVRKNEERGMEKDGRDSEMCEMGEIERKRE